MVAAAAEAATAELTATAACGGFRAFLGAVFLGAAADFVTGPRRAAGFLRGEFLRVANRVFGIAPGPIVPPRSLAPCPSILWQTT